MANSELESRNTDPSEDPLWARIEAYEFDALDPSQAFAARLARERLWTTDYAERVIEEYRRFCYLAVRAGHPVVPSDHVDRVWHLHIGYSRAYWQEFCADVLKFELHRAPPRTDTVGGGEDRRRYERTLEAYERISGERPPADIWPIANIRFAGEGTFRHVSTRDYLVVRRPPKGVLWIGQLVLVLAAVYFLWDGAFGTAAAVGVMAGLLSIYRDWTDNPWTKPTWHDHEEDSLGTRRDRRRRYRRRNNDLY